MAKVQQIIGRALRLLRTTDADEPIEAIDFSTGIDALNAMMRRWEANGMPLGWQPVDNPADTMPSPDEAEEAIVYNLATRLRSEYGGTLDGDVIQMANDSLAILRRDVLASGPLVAETGLPRRYGRYNAYTDTYY
jgi:hypothetical protein